MKNNSNKNLINEPRSERTQIKSSDSPESPSPYTQEGENPSGSAITKKEKSYQSYAFSFTDPNTEMNLIAECALLLRSKMLMMPPVDISRHLEGSEKPEAASRSCSQNRPVTSREGLNPSDETISESMENSKGAAVLTPDAHCFCLICNDSFTPCMSDRFCNDCAICSMAKNLKKAGTTAYKAGIALNGISKSLKRYFELFPPKEKNLRKKIKILKTYWR